MKIIASLFLLSVLLTWGAHASLTKRRKKGTNNRPIIAILAMRHPASSDRSYIAASYVKYIESSGARVVPIPHYFSEKKVARIFKYVNGVLFPGGTVSLSKSDYYTHAKLIWKLALAANEKGNYFPIWGTARGFQAMQVLRGGKDVLTQRITKGHSYKLDFTKYAKRSKMFRYAPKDVYKALGSEKLTFNLHQYGVTQRTYEKNLALRKFFKVLSVNTDSYGYEFISTVEAYKYPIYGTAWHPEKNRFEFSLWKEVPHSANAIKAAQYMGNFFVNEARKNSQKFPSEEMEKKYLIYNYKPTHSAILKDLPSFEQVYYF